MAKLKDFQKLEDLRVVKFATKRQQIGSHFAVVGLFSFVITNGNKQMIQIH